MVKSTCLNTTCLTIIESYTGNNKLSHIFKSSMHQYNNSVFVPFGNTIGLPPNHGLYCFKILGVVRHLISPLLIFLFSGITSSSICMVNFIS